MIKATLKLKFDPDDLVEQYEEAAQDTVEELERVVSEKSRVSKSAGKMRLTSAGVPVRERKRKRPGVLQQKKGSAKPTEEETQEIFDKISSRIKV